MPSARCISIQASLALALLMPLARLTAADPPTQSRVLLKRLASAPFPHPSRSAGFTYEGKQFPAATHYQDNLVAIAFPKGFQSASSVDLVVHFHGWHNNVTNVLGQFRLLEQLEASGRNAILVIPQGPRNAPDSSGGRLEESNAFRQFIQDVLQTVRTELGRDVTLGRITLSGHSGAYRVIGWILARGGLDEAIREVFLFDAIYAQTEQFSAWLTRDGHRFVAIYNDAGGTLHTTRSLLSELKAKNVSFLDTRDPGWTDADLRRHRTAFLHTNLPHNDVLAARSHFEAFLRTGTNP